MCSVCVYVHAYVWVFTSLLQSLIPAPLRCSFTAHSLHYTVIITPMLSLPSPLSSLLLSLLLSVSLSSPPPFFCLLHLSLSFFHALTLFHCFHLSASPPLPSPLFLSIILSSSSSSSGGGSFKAAKEGKADDNDDDDDDDDDDAGPNLFK